MKTGSIFYAGLCALVYYYMVGAWGTQAQAAAVTKWAAIASKPPLLLFVHPCYTICSNTTTSLLTSRWLRLHHQPHPVARSCPHADGQVLTQSVHVLHDVVHSWSHPLDAGAEQKRLWECFAFTGMASRRDLRPCRPPRPRACASSLMSSAVAFL